LLHAELGPTIAAMKKTSALLALAVCSLASPALAKDNQLPQLGGKLAMQDVVIEVDASQADIVDPATSHAQGYHILYVNPCRGSVTINRGFNDSRSNSSSIIDRTRTFAPYPYGESSWEAVMSEVKDILLPYGITVTDQDPGNEPHTEIIACGNSFLGQGVLGVAPFACGVVQNAIGYAFASDHGNNPRFLAHTIAHEAGHTFSLNHLYDCEDPMTYLTGCGEKYFQDSALACAEVSQTGQWTTAPCSCGGSTQNSHQTLLQAFGPRELAPPSVSITQPAQGARVEPGFVVRIDATSDTDLVAARFYLDDELVSDVSTPPFVFNAPDVLDIGSYQLTVEVDDKFGNTGSDAIAVYRGAPCDCSADEVCVDGLCTPGPDVAGGLGTSCEDSTDCESGLCGQTSSGGFCTATCEEGNEYGCPDGFECLQSSGGGVCWWQDGDGSESGTCGCRAGNQGGFPAAALILGLAFFGLRRRQ
jgi:MYXO-CTERM domain-containing protein